MAAFMLQCQGWVVATAVIAPHCYSAHSKLQWHRFDSVLSAMHIAILQHFAFFCFVTSVYHHGETRKVDFENCTFKVQWHVDYSVIKFRWQSVVFIMQ